MINKLLILGICLIVLWFGFVFAFSFSNSTNNISLACIRGFYSDELNKGYESDLVKFCNQR